MSRYLVRSLTGLAVVAMAVVLASPARAQDAKPKKSPEYAGAITAVDAKAGTVTLQKKDGDSKTFSCAVDCKFGGKEDKAKSLADYKVGDKVTAHYTDDAGKLVCHKLSLWHGRAKKSE